MAWEDARQALRVRRDDQEKHITLAWGRDYDDVSPIKGVILGGGRHSISVGVDVMEVEAN